MVDQGITFSLSGQERPFPLDLVPRVIHGGGVDEARARRRAARPRARGVPRRHLRRPADPARRRAAAPADHLVRALPPRGVRHQPAERRAHPRVRHRPGARRGGHVPGAGGQPPRPVRGVVRDGEPADDGAGLPGPVRPAPGPAGRRLRGAPARGAARGGRAERRRPDGRRAHPRRLQLGVLRALAAGPADGRRAGRGPRPVLPRQRRLPADDRGRAPGRRRSTGASTTSSSIRCTSGRTRCSASPACSTRRARATSSIANAVGNGVGDDKLVYTYVPEMVEVLPRREAAAAQRGHLPAAGCRTSSTHVMDHLDELVVKPVEGSGGYGIVFGPEATAKELATLRRKVRANPRGWIAQPVVQLSTVPAKVERPARAAARRPAAVRRQRRQGRSSSCPAG